MAHFYGDLQGNRGEATRCGSKDSGIRSHVRGWNVGCLATCFTDDQGRDCVGITVTSGSGYNNGATLSLGTFTRIDNKLVKI